MCKAWPCSPHDDLIDQRLLLCAGLGQVDLGGLDALMTQKIGQQRDIIELQKEILCVQMPEGVGVDGGGVDAVLLGEFLQLAVDPPGCDLLAPAVQKDEAGGDLLFREPL